MTRLVPVADYDRAIAQRDTANAQRDAAVTALRDVMRTLSRQASGPNDAKIYARARELLAEAGVNGAETAQYQAAYEQWQERVAQREAKRAGCVHDRVFDGRCLTCGVPA